MPTLSASVFAFQGVFLFCNGLYTLLFPLSASGPSSPLSGAPIPVIYALSISSLTPSAHYLLAAYQRNRVFMLASVPLRLLASVVLGRQGGAWGKVAVYEAVMGVVCALVLMWEERW